MRIRSIEALERELDLDFTEIEITNIWVKHNQALYILAIGSDDVLPSSVFIEVELYNMIKGNVVRLDEAGFSIDDVLEYWVHYKDKPVRMWVTSYEIEVYKLNEPLHDNSNMLIVAPFPVNVTINKDRIMAQQQRLHSKTERVDEDSPPR
ncbi:MAG: hypothetical protein FWE20_12150 [Defluviitaleaceae bacterium]|nr:hypothetical protein [Defluviitaleaceae bacterium]